MSQETLQKVVKSFDVITYNYGVGKCDTQVPYEFHYSGDIPIESVKGSCSCVGMKVIDNGDGSQVIKGELKLSKAESYTRKPAQYILDAENILWLIQGKMAVSIDPRFGRKPVEEVKGEPKYVAEQTITVSFADGQLAETVDNDKVLRANSNKLQTQLKITGFVDIS